MNTKSFTWVAALTFALVLPLWASAHCDTMAGPVVLDAKTALASGDITPVLKWIKAEHEQEVRESFARAMQVRSEGAQAQELADQYFFETVVRLHRLGEGAPFEGLKPAEDVEPITLHADKALQSGTADSVVVELQEAVAAGVRGRFARVIEAKKHATDSVVAGRDFVAAYVEFTHYVERLHAAGSGSSHGRTQGVAAQAH
ncbi:MAG: DUF6448 family protein [Terriglobales bacterium]